MKRVVERVANAADAGEAPAVESDDADAPVVAKAAPRRRAQGMADPHGDKAPESRAYVPPADDNAHAQGRESLKQILARAEGGKAKPKPEKQVEPTQEMLDAIEKEAEEPEVPPEDDNPDPDAHVSDESEETTEPGTPAAKETKAEGEFEYLTPAQRQELAAKMGEKRRERELEAELKRAQAERDALKAKAGGSLDDRLSVVGKSREELLEELLVGGGQQPAADDMTPRERELAQRLAQLEKTIADSQKQQTTAQVQAARNGALTRIQQLVTAEHFPMVAAMGAHADVLTEGEGLYDAAEEDGKGYGLRVMQVAADRIEQQLRQKYPAIAAKVIGDEPARPAPAAAKPKPTVGSRSAPATAKPKEEGTPSNGVPYDDSRHAEVRARFFGRGHRA